MYGGIFRELGCPDLSWNTYVQILLLLHQALNPGSVQIGMQGRSVATVNRADYMAPVFPLLADDKIDRLLDDLDKKCITPPECPDWGSRGDHSGTERLQAGSRSFSRAILFLPLWQRFLVHRSAALEDPCQGR